MKTFLSILGGVFLSLLVGIGGMVAYGAVEVSKLNVESKSYVEANLSSFFSHSSADKLANFMAPQDKANVKADQWVSYYSFVNQKLGEFKSFEGLDGGASEMVSPDGKTITASYKVRCYFDKASIVASVSLRKLGETWSLVGLHLDTDTLGPARDGGKSI